MSAVVVGAAMACSSAASAKDAAPQHDLRRLTVAVYDYVGVDAGTLASAQQVAGDVYRRAGIEIEWVEAESFEGVGRLYVYLLSKRMSSEFSLSKDTVGYATPGSLAASAIYDRIQEVAHDRRLPAGVMLGYVIAHELGHLLLPAHSHSDTGLMRANLDVQLAANRKLRFTSDQAALMLERLTVSPVVSTH